MIGSSIDLTTIEFIVNYFPTRVTMGIAALYALYASKFEIRVDLTGGCFGVGRTVNAFLGIRGSPNSISGIAMTEVCLKCGLGTRDGGVRGFGRYRGGGGAQFGNVRN